MGVLEVRQAGEVLQCSLEERYHKYASLKCGKLKISITKVSFFSPVERTAVVA